MKALTLWQPWAWAIAHAGKDIENRRWAPWKSIIGQRIAIHAGKRIDRDAIRSLCNALGELGADGPALGDLVTSSVVAVTTVVGSVTSSSSPWFFGPYGWSLEDTITLPEPVRCSGHQGIWTLPIHVDELVTQQIEAA